MVKQASWTIAGLAVTGCLYALTGCGSAQAQETGASSTARTIELVVYKEDFAVVSEFRPVELAEGRNRLRFDNVSKTLDPVTVDVMWKDTSKAPEVVSKTYDLGVQSGGSLLQRLEGKKVEMLWNTQDGEPRDKIEGILEATGDGGFVIRSGDKLYVNPNGTIVASGETGLATLPQLSAEVDSPSKQAASLGVAYQTRGMSWSADYVGRLSPDGTAMQLECWATLQNHTGIDYPDAKITLVAGSPNRAALPAEMRGRDQSGFGLADSRLDYDMKAKAGSVDPFNNSRSLGELHAYSVPAAASIGQEQMNRVKMLSSASVPVKKDYSVRFDPIGSYDYGYVRSQRQRRSANLAISFVNDSKSGLGMPLPAGAVRVQDDSAGSIAVIGSAGIGDTPKDEKVNLSLSQVFDVYTQSRVASIKKVDKRTLRKVFESTLHNEKKVDIELRIVQDFYGKKKVVSESAIGKQLSSTSREWKVTIPAGGSKTFTWTVDFAS